MTPKFELVHAVRITATCDCGGTYAHTGQDDLINHTYTHRCTKCRSEIKTQEKFPTVKFFTEEEMTVFTK